MDQDLCILGIYALLGSINEHGKKTLSHKEFLLNTFHSVEALSGGNINREATNMAIELILDIFRNHIENYNICFSGCRALCIITHNDSKYSTYIYTPIFSRFLFTYTQKSLLGESRDEAIGLEGIELVLKVMKKHLSRGEICGLVCEVLYYMTSQNSKHQPQKTHILPFYLLVYFTKLYQGTTKPKQ